MVSSLIDGFLSHTLFDAFLSDKTRELLFICKECNEILLLVKRILLFIITQLVSVFTTILLV